MLENVRSTPKSGDLSNFGEINKTEPMTFGPTGGFPRARRAQRPAHRGYLCFGLELEHVLHCAPRIQWTQVGPKPTKYQSSGEPEVEY